MLDTLISTRGKKKFETHLFVLLEKLIIFLLQFLLQCGDLFAQLCDGNDVITVTWDHDAVDRLGNLFWNFRETCFREFRSL